MNETKIVYNNELYHHGILGQKWGVRRYQNPDGSLTPEGVKRYENPTKHDTKRYKAASAAIDKYGEKIAKAERAGDLPTSIDTKKKALVADDIYSDDFAYASKKKMTKNVSIAAFVGHFLAGPILGVPAAAIVYATSPYKKTADEITKKYNDMPVEELLKEYDSRITSIKHE